MNKEKKKHWGEGFNSSEEIRAGFIEGAILGRTLDHSCSSKWGDPRKQREGVRKIGKGVKPIMGTLMSRLLLGATGAHPNNLRAV